MADSTDEEKAKKLAEGVEGASPAEPETPATQPTNPEDEPADKSTDEQDKPAEPDEENATFTKPEGFEWVKGDTEKEFIDNLTIAYKNSTAEALRLKQVAEQPAPQPAQDAPTQAPALTPEQQQALQYAQATQQSEMVKAFDDFAKVFPQAREPQAFDQFTKASNGVAQGFVAAFSRVPTYPELFERTAQILGWKPEDGKKDAAIKEAAAEGNVVNSAPKTVPKTRLTESQLEMGRKMLPNLSDQELAKELSANLT